MRAQKQFLLPSLLLAVLASALVPTAANCETPIDTLSGDSTYYYYHEETGSDGADLLLNGGDFSLDHAKGRVHDLKASASGDTIGVNPNADLTISVANKAAAEHSYGIYLKDGTWNLFSGGNKYSFTATNGEGDTTSRRIYALYLASGTATNRGTITVDGSGANSGLFAEGVHVESSGSTFINYGTISANSAGRTQAVAVRDGGTFVNHGILSATTTGLPAYAVYAEGLSSVELGTGTVIKNGTVMGNSSNAPLTVSSNSASPLACVLGGNWGVTSQTGSTTWQLLSGSNAKLRSLTLSNGKLLLDSGAALEVTHATNVGSGATLSLSEGATMRIDDFNLASGGTLFMSLGAVPSYQLRSGGTVTLQSGSSLVVSPTSEGTLKLISAEHFDGYDTTLSVDTANPNYKLSELNVSSTSMGGAFVTTEATYAPPADQSSQSLQGSVAASQSFASVATGRCINLLSNVMGASFAGMGTSDGSAFSQDESGYVMVASAGDLSGLLNPKTEEPAWGVFAEPVVGKSHRAVVDGQGYDSKYAGFQFGADRFLNSDLLVGFTGGLGYMGIDFTGDDFYSKDTDKQMLYIAGAYAGYKWGDFSFIDLLSNTYVTHDSKRHSSATDYAEGDYSSNIMANEIIGSYTWNMDETWTLMPHLGYRISRLTREAFEETNSANAIKYDNYHKIFHDLTAGVRATGHFTSGEYALAPYADLGVIQALANNDLSVTQTLVGTATSYNVTSGNDNTHVSLETGCAISTGPYEVTLGYEGRRSDNEYAHSLSALVRWEF